MNATIYRHIPHKLNPTEAIIEILRIISEYEAQFQAKLKGYRPHYGPDIKKLKKRSKKEPFVSDGRAPDTSKALLIDTNKKKLGRPKGSQNAIRDPKITIRSYAHQENTCYLTSLLTCLFASFLKLNDDPELVPLFDNLKKGSMIFAIIDHFKERIASDNSEKTLNKGLKFVADFVIDKKGAYKRNEFGSPVTSLSKRYGKIILELLLECENDDECLKALFLIDLKKKFTCVSCHSSFEKDHCADKLLFLGHASDQSFGGDVKVFLELLIS